MIGAEAVEAQSGQDDDADDALVVAHGGQQHRLFEVVLRARYRLRARVGRGVGQVFGHAVLRHPAGDAAAHLQSQLLTVLARVPADLAAPGDGEDFIARDPVDPDVVVVDEAAELQADGLAEVSDTVDNLPRRAPNAWIDWSCAAQVAVRSRSRALPSATPAWPAIAWSSSRSSAFQAVARARNTARAPRDSPRTANGSIAAARNPAAPSASRTSASVTSSSRSAVAAACPVVKASESRGMISGAPQVIPGSPAGSHRGRDGERPVGGTFEDRHVLHVEQPRGVFHEPTQDHRRLWKRTQVPRGLRQRAPPSRRRGERIAIRCHGQHVGDGSEQIQVATLDGRGRPRLGHQHAPGRLAAADGRVHLDHRPTLRAARPAGLRFRDHARGDRPLLRAADAGQALVHAPPPRAHPVGALAQPRCESTILPLAHRQHAEPAGVAQQPERPTQRGFQIAASGMRTGQPADRPEQPRRFCLLVALAARCPTRRPPGRRRGRCRRIPSEGTSRSVAGVHQGLVGGGDHTRRVEGDVSSRRGPEPALEGEWPGRLQAGVSQEREQVAVLVATVAAVVDADAAEATLVGPGADGVDVHAQQPGGTAHGERRPLGSRVDDLEPPEESVRGRDVRRVGAWTPMGPWCGSTRPLRRRRGPRVGRFSPRA